MSLDDPAWLPDDEPEEICPVTGSYCTGRFCDEYGCAKEAGFWDGEEDDDGVG